MLAHADSTTVPDLGVRAMKSPPAEHQIDAQLVRALLLDQHPDLSARPLVHLSEGWDNSLWRLGDDLMVRLPRRSVAAPLMASEQRWLPLLAGRLPLPIPAPVRVGRPGRGYPWRWSVVPFLAGSPASLAPPLADEGAALVLGGFLRALHTDAPPDAPANPMRGVPLVQRSELFDARVAELPDADLARRARGAWSVALAAPGFVGAPRWLHGDLHPGNLLVDGDALVGVVDFGDLTAGDPATDVAACWLALADRPLVEAALDAYGACDDALVARAKGWALAFSVLLATIEDGMLGLAPTGLASLERLLRPGGS